MVTTRFPGLSLLRRQGQEEEVRPVPVISVGDLEAEGVAPRDRLPKPYLICWTRLMSSEPIKTPSRRRLLLIGLAALALAGGIAVYGTIRLGLAIQVSR